MHACGSESQLYPGIHEEKCGQQVERGDSAPPLHSGESPPGVLCPALEPSAQERRGPVGFRGLEPLSYERVGAVQPGGEKALGRPYHSLSAPEGAYKKAGEVLFTRAHSDSTRGNGFKLREGSFRLNVRKKFFVMMVVRLWHRLPREAVGAPSLAVFKARLDGALSSLVWWEGSLPVAGGVGRSLLTQTAL